MTKQIRDRAQSFQKYAIFSGIAVLFVGLAAKVAFVRQFPLPYDEWFHVGLIRLYAHHLNPFIAAQPAGADNLGAVARDPSYLYHYLMSFPYRVIAIFVHSDIAQVWALRGLNLVLGIVTLGLLYRLARRCGLPVLGSQLVVLALAVTPVFYDLAAQVNYDNLLLPLTLVSLLLTIRVRDQLRAGAMPVAGIVGLYSLLLVSSLVKYSFLPIMLGIALYVSVLLLRQIGLRQTASRFVQSYGLLTKSRQLAIVAAVLLSSLLWVQRYGVNMVTYHTPHPQCDTVLSVAACSSYGPWARNYQLHQTRGERPMAGNQFIAFTRHWAREVYTQIYCLISNQPDGATVYTQQNGVRHIAKFVIVFGVLSAILTWQTLMRRRRRWALFALIGSLYLISLFVQNYADFHNLHAMIAIQGRYLLPVIPMAYIAIAAASSLVVEDARHAAHLAYRRLTPQRRTSIAHSWYSLFNHSNGPRTFP